MAKFLYLSSHGSDDPTRACVAFVAANGAVEAGHQAEIALLGEAVYLLKEAVANAIVPVGWPPLKDLMARAIQGGVQIHV